MPDAPLRLGMIGCGQISARFFKQASELEGVRFVATCAAHEESAKKAAAANGCERWTTNYHELLAASDIDAVVITTPHQMHASMATDAAKAGKHVLIEKPMSSRWDQTEALVKAVEASGVTAMALPYDDSPALLTAMRYVREDVIGKITAVESELNRPGPPRSNWYYSKEAEGGAMLDTAPYALSRVASIMGPARRAAGFINRLIPMRLTGDGGKVHSEVDDNVTIVLEYASGQHAVVRTCWAYSYAQNGTVIHGRHGDVFINEYGKPVVVRSKLGPVPDAEPVEFLGLSDCYAPRELATVEPIVEHFANAIRRGDLPHANVWQAAHVMEQTLKVRHATDTGKTVTLETSFVPWWHVPAGIQALDGQWL